MLPAPSLKAAFVEAPGEPKFRCLPPAAVTEQCGVPGVDDFGDGKLAAPRHPRLPPWSSDQRSSPTAEQGLALKPCIRCGSGRRGDWCGLTASLVSEVQPVKLAKPLEDA
mmetsp:Transcript_44970/g.97685  ORF Transcript_44970/g.97685 Transcript_44970/m.97685 type:complete len:110 (+) Transcript_44970:191-520(+)